MSVQPWEGRATSWTAGCDRCSCVGLSSRFLNVSTETVDVCSRQTKREWGERGKKTFCIITTFRKERALKGNIFSKALGCLLHTIFGEFVCSFPPLFPIISPAPHTQKFISKRLVFLHALNYS